MFIGNRDLIHQSFGRLTVTNRLHDRDKSGNVQWQCICSCGNTTIVSTVNLKRGNTRSCGCLRKEMMTKHGMNLSSEYKIWSAIKQRCYNEKHESYDLYGRHGITMCDEWKESFEAFYRDMGPRPSDDHSIDRKDNDLGYSKSNCRWSTHKEQANNRRSNTLYEFNGETKTLADWCRDLNIDYETVHSRLCRGWTFEKSVKQKIVSPKKTKYAHNGKIQTLTEWCDELNLKYTTVYMRLQRGWSFERAIKECHGVKMSVPITDNRYFTLGVDEELSTKIEAYDPEVYEREYPRISTQLPEMFSINLKGEMEVFITSSPPQFEVTVNRAIDLACYYYSDWDTMVVVMDEFIHTEVFHKAEKDTLAARHASPEAAARLEEAMIALSEALTAFVGVIIGMLTRARIPAITEYGCCYRLENIDDYGNVFFRLRNPSQVYADLNGGICDAGQVF